MRHIWQSNETNPALVPEQRFVMGLPSLGSQLLFDGPTYNQIFTEQNGQSVIEIDRFIEHLRPENTLRNDLQINTLSMALRLGKLSLSAGHSLRYHAFFKYPKTLPQVVWQGNAQFIGQTVELGNELQLTGYQELALGLAYDFGKLTLGAKAKLLGGIADVSTDRDHHSATLYTDPDIYQITLKGDYVLHSAGTIDYDSYQDINADFDYGQVHFRPLFEANPGFAFDLGARFQTDKWDISASLLDIGGLDWQEDVSRYAAAKTYEYEGLDFSGALTDGENPDFDSALDTIEQIFQVEKTVGKFAQYRYKLPRKAYLSVRYKLSERWSVGGLFFQEKFRGETQSGFALGANANLFKCLNAGLAYGYRNERFDNLGLNLTLKLGPVQIFALSDNVISLLNFREAHNFSGRIGGNLVF